MFAIQLISAFICGTCLFVVSVHNTIHSLLFLNCVFFIGSVFLIYIQIDYFAILFLIVYVGAIVVLFLFVIMRLELKLVNVTSGMNDFFTFRNLICSFFIIEVLILSSNQFFDLGFFMEPYRLNSMSNFIETNEYFNIATLINHSDILRQLGNLLFTEYPISVIIVSILLFVSIVGALAITLYFSVNKFINPFKN